MTLQERAEAIGMLRAGMPLNDIATHFTVCKKIIQRMAHRYNLIGEVKDRARSGRPRITTQAEDRRIRTAHLREGTRTASKTAREWMGNNPITRFIVRRRLKSFGISCRHPVKKFGLTGCHRTKRLNWVRTYRRWTLRQWGFIERNLRQRPNPPQNEHELFQALRDEWNNPTDDSVRRLVLSMRRRVTALFAAGGGHTKY